MSKLWAKGCQLDSLIERFTVGEDYKLDSRLIPADILGSLAHAAMLNSLHLLSADQYSALKEGLLQILEEHESGRFTIAEADEDGHTAIENRLTKLTGDTGKRIHLGRSRNDQVLTAMRIWMRHAVFQLAETGAGLIAELLDFAQKGENIPMPGRTHTQPAMPSSVGLWAGGFAEQLTDDIQGIAHLFPYLDQCPLGTGAGYGVPLPLNRELTASLLGFSRIQNNAAYCGLSRGKFESRLIDAAEQAAITLSKLAADLILFSLPEFGWFTLPAELCTGSSIMPQKRNPDALELMRAKAASVGGWSVQVKNIIRALPSGYNRDYQDTKEPVMRTVDTVLIMLQTAQLTINRLEINHPRLEKSFDSSLFATDAAIALTSQGVSFREAYRKTAAHPEKVASKNPREAIAERTSSGTPGNLRLDRAHENLETLRQETSRRRSETEAALTKLAGHPVLVFA
ncbi:MAG: argininosuccinate lyase [Spirochaeta sp. LUC14_002_19_P3]|nr:MAG: argininosuccinate lyase [Spirochaeta sp. LUC14_002_19_P3]